MAMGWNHLKVLSVHVRWLMLAVTWDIGGEYYLEHMPMAFLCGLSSLPVWQPQGSQPSSLLAQGSESKRPAGNVKTLLPLIP